VCRRFKSVLRYHLVPPDERQRLSNRRKSRHPQSAFSHLPVGVVRPLNPSGRRGDRDRVRLGFEKFAPGDAFGPIGPHELPCVGILFGNFASVWVPFRELVKTTAAPSGRSSGAGTRVPAIFAKQSRAADSSASNTYGAEAI
jgi:hypothetical protein